MRTRLQITTRHAAGSAGRPSSAFVPLAGAPTGRVTGRSKAAVMPQREVRAGGASFPAGGVSPHFDVAMSCTFYKTPRAHAVFSQPAASSSRASYRPIPKLKVKFFFTKIPLPWKPTLTERACGRRPCRVLTSCVQLVASQIEGEQPDPGASKITVYACTCAVRPNPGHCAGRRRLLGKLYSE